MEPKGGLSNKSSSSRFSSSGQKCERDLAFKIEDVRPWGVEQKFSAAFADVSAPFPGLAATSSLAVQRSIPRFPLALLFNTSDLIIGNDISGIMARCMESATVCLRGAAGAFRPAALILHRVPMPGGAEVLSPFDVEAVAILIVPGRDGADECASLCDLQCVKKPS
jgi:hypothetical protein